MKKTIYRLLALLVTVSVFFAACTKEDPDVKLDPKLSTSQLSNITSDGATLTGFVIAAGSGVVEKGIVYNTSPKPTIANSKAVYTGDTKGATYPVTLTGLNYATKYYACSYATLEDGSTIYGEEFNFTTLPVVPTVNTAAVIEIAGKSASCGGIVMVTGGAVISKQGVCWSTKPNPTVADSKTEDGNGSGPYVSVLTNLKGKTTYYVRAYATNSAGTGYGPEVLFTTLVAVPDLTTNAATNVGASSATSGGKITADGGAAITAKGVCWSTSANPTIADSKTSNGSGTADFTSNITGLNIATTYHVRSYATNSAGTGYGADITFMTFPTAIYALGDGTEAGWDNTKALQMNQSSTAGVYVAELNLTAEKNLKFILTLGQWQPQWGQASGQPAGTLGANLGGGSDPDAIPTPKPDGKYKVTVDLGKMTYTIAPAIPLELYMIGDGVGEWDWSKTDLPMIPVNSHPNLFWKIVWMKAAGGFKFAPQKEWKDDFGKTGSATVSADGTVYAKGGDNIDVPGTPGYYMVVVDYTGGKIAIADPKVYLMGNTIGSWETGNPNGLFTVDNANHLVTITKTLAADELRMYAWHPWFTDWWQSEFIILDNKIEFRGKGGDQTRVPVTAGSHTIDLNFQTGAGEIK